jgi:hypothetical protein
MRQDALRWRRERAAEAAGLFSRFMYHIEESDLVPEMPPPKRVKDDSAPVSEGEEFYEDLARLKGSNSKISANSQQRRKIDEVTWTK